MKISIALTAIALAIPAMAQATDTTPSQAFARAWIDPETISSFAHAALQEKLRRCVSAGTLSEQQLENAQPALSRYLAVFDEGLGRVQDQVAQSATSMLSNADLRQIAATFGSPLFRRMRREGLRGMAQNMAPRIPGCGDSSRPITVEQLGAQARTHLSPQEIARFRLFVMSPAGQHFNRVVPQLTTVLMQAYRDQVALAMQAVGATPDMVDAMRAMPSPITTAPAQEAAAPQTK